MRKGEKEKEVRKSDLLVCSLRRLFHFSRFKCIQTLSLFLSATSRILKHSSSTTWCQATCQGVGGWHPCPGLNRPATSFFSLISSLLPLLLPPKAEGGSIKRGLSSHPQTTQRKIQDFIRSINSGKFQEQRGRSSFFLYHVHIVVFVVVLAERTKKEERWKQRCAAAAAAAALFISAPFQLLHIKDISVFTGWLGKWNKNWIEQRGEPPKAKGTTLLQLFPKCSLIKYAGYYGL